MCGTQARYKQTFKGWIQSGKGTVHYSNMACAGSNGASEWRYGEDLRACLHSLVPGVEAADTACHKAVALAQGVQSHLDLQLPVFTGQ